GGSSAAARTRSATCAVIRAAASSAAVFPVAADQARSATAAPAQPVNSPSSSIVLAPGPWSARYRSRPKAPARTWPVPIPAARAGAEPRRGGLGAAEQPPGRAGVQEIGHPPALEPGKAAVGTDRDRANPAERTAGQVRQRFHHDVNASPHPRRGLGKVVSWKSVR